MAFLSPLSEEQRTTLLVVSLPQRALRRLVGSLGTASKGSRLDRLTVWDLAWTLVDYYENDAEVSAEVDRLLLRELGASPLAPAVVSEQAVQALSELVLRAHDPLRDLAWAILSSAPQGAGSAAGELVEAIVAEFDDAQARAKAEEEARAASETGETGEPATPDPEEVARHIEKETQSAKRGRARALKRADDMKSRVADLEATLAEANRSIKIERAARADADAERARAEEERDRLRSRLKEGTAAEVERLGARIADEERRIRSLEDDLQGLRDEGDRLRTRLREAEERRPAPSDEGSAPTDGRPDPSTFSLPVFTAEFYESIKAWDKKILRIAFEKVVRLAEDWRHPSLRAIPLEGLPGHYRIRIASDVRLIYRLPEGGRLEILSLIDREDLTRYIRTSK